MEFDRSQERHWYRVEINWVAEFIVRAYSPEAALHKVDLYCQSQPALDLQLEPEGTLPLMPERAFRPEPSVAACLDRLGDEDSPVRLVGDKRKIRNDPETTSICADKRQLTIFNGNES